MNRVLKYPGSKQRLAKDIISLIPEHHSYLEPFAGSVAVLLNKPVSNIETVNDLDSDVVNLFRVIRDYPEKLIDEISFTPYSRYEYENSYSLMDVGDVEKARRFLIRCWQGHGFRSNKYKVGWKNDVQGREASYAVRDWNRLPGRVAGVVERLKNVQIESMDATNLIKRFNHSNVFIYADPPYLLSTRSGESYKYEMSDVEHIELLSALSQHNGPVMLSGYENDIYDGLLSGWHRKQISATAEYGKPRTETIWMNYTNEITFFNMHLQEEVV